MLLLYLQLPAARFPSSASFPDPSGFVRLREHHQFRLHLPFLDEIWQHDNIDQENDRNWASTSRSSDLGVPWPHLDIWIVRHRRRKVVLPVSFLHFQFIPGIHDFPLLLRVLCRGESEVPRTIFQQPAKAFEAARQSADTVCIWDHAGQCPWITEHRGSNTWWTIAGSGSW